MGSSCTSLDDSRQVTVPESRRLQSRLLVSTAVSEREDSSVRSDLPDVRVVLQQTLCAPPLTATRPAFSGSSDPDDGITANRSSLEPLAASRLSIASAQAVQVSSTNSTRTRCASSRNCRNENRSYSGSQASTGKDPSLHPVLTEWSTSLEMSSTGERDAFDVSSVRGEANR